MGTYINEEGHVYRRDQAGRVLVVETDHTKELADALEMLARELPRTREHLHAWKWAVISAHNAVQNIIADCAAGDRSRRTKELRKLGDRIHKAPNEAARQGALSQYLSRMWDLIRVGKPQLELLAFVELFDLVNAKWGLAVPVGLRQRMVDLNCERNAWTHFGAGSYEFEVDGYPSLLLDCLGWVEFLGWRTQLVFWFDNKVKDRARASLDTCLMTLKELEVEYS